LSKAKRETAQVVKTESCFRKGEEVGSCGVGCSGGKGGEVSTGRRYIEILAKERVKLIKKDRQTKRCQRGPRAENAAKKKMGAWVGQTITGCLRIRMSGFRRNESEQPPGNSAKKGIQYRVEGHLIFK